MKDHGPSIWVPPPLFFAVGIFGGWGLDRLVPLGTIPTSWKPVGLGLFFTGLLLCMVALATMVGHRTSAVPHQPARTLVTSGLFRFSRNPIYLGFVFASLGIGIAAPNLWILLLLPLVIWVFTVQVIGKEERYLRERFGEAYERYCREVRRWL